MLEVIGYTAQQDIDWQGDCTLRKEPMLDYDIPVCRLTDAQRLLSERDAAIEEWSGTAVQNGMEVDRLREQQQLVDDLSALVRQLAHRLSKSAPANDLPAKALDYLKRKGLQGSPLRNADA